MMEKERLLAVMQDAGIRLIYEEPDDFHGKCCSTGSHNEIGHPRSLAPLSELCYYIQSLPGKGGTKHIAASFQLACEEWQKYTGITFTRVSKHDQYDFLVRMADKTEEEEQPSQTIAGFSWQQSGKKVVRLWKSAVHWNYYALFLHIVGHIMGLKHSDVFLTPEQRTSLSSRQREFHNLCDEDSIMSHYYLSRFQKDMSTNLPQLSRHDVAQVTYLYRVC